MVYRRMRALPSVMLLLPLLASGCKTATNPSDDSSSSASGTPGQVENPCPNRFLGKLPGPILQSYGTPAAKRLAETPWVDWQGLLGSDGTSSPNKLLATLSTRVENYNGLFSGMIKNITQRAASADASARAEIGMLIALLSLEQQRVDLLRCNIWDTNGTIDTYKPGDVKNHDQRWASLQDPSANCTGDRARFRTMDGKCNSLENPLMGATGQRFGRNVSFAATQPRPGISPSDPDPSLISQKLLTRRGSPSQYRPAPFFNLIAASWIQFMTHDWFAHAKRGHNDESKRLQAGKVTIPATIADDNPSPAVSSNPSKRPGTGTFRNNVSFWWDASQIYGSDTLSANRVRNPKNRALLLTDDKKMLPTFKELYGEQTPEKLAAQQLNSHEWDQEVSGFADNWWIGLSLLETAFVREHNRFVTELAKAQYQTDVASLTPAQQEEAYQYGRLYISALIAKIHTIEWTPQLLFNPVLDAGMNSNWHGIAAHRFGADNAAVTKFQTFAQHALQFIKDENKSPLPFESNTLFAYGVAGPGIVGGPTNHFGGPFTLPEEFTTVYRLHPLVPDQLEYRNLQSIVNGTARAGDIAKRIDTEDVIRGNSAQHLTESTIGDWWVTFGIQPTGTLTLHNYPRFLQKLEIKQNPDWASAGNRPREMDLAALEIMRDRERGVPRYNEFRRQIGLKALTSYDDFINQELAWSVFTACGVKDYNKSMLRRDVADKLQCPNTVSADLQELRYQIEQRDLLAEVYGNDAGGIERIDPIVGIFAENTRPHGFAISETQFHIFILNASRRLFSDRFLSKDFNPKTYTQFGYRSLQTRGMRDVLMDNFPELRPVVSKVQNAFDPWTRPRRGFSLASGFDPVNFHGKH
jgi:Animal haem peroxidase